MEPLLANDNSWWSLVFIAFVSIVFILLLKALNNLIVSYNKVGVIFRPKFLNRLVEKIIFVSEPIIATILICQFILINPVVHSIISFVFLSLIFVQIRSYIAGRIILFREQLTDNMKIQVGELQGRIIGFHRFGFDLREEDIKHYINYYELIKHGFAVLPTRNTGKAIQLHIHFKESEFNESTIDKFRFFLFDIPYLNMSLKPNIQINSVQNEISVKVLLHTSANEHAFVNMLTEAGYNISIKN